jgi:hypothetical protein
MNEKYSKKFNRKLVVKYLEVCSKHMSIFYPLTNEQNAMKAFYLSSKICIRN